MSLTLKQKSQKGPASRLDSKPPKMPTADKPEIVFWERAPPLAALAVAKLGSYSWKVKAQQQGSKDGSALLRLPTG